MYDLVYEQMVDDGVAEYLPPEEYYWVDEGGDTTASEDQAASHKCTIRLLHPDWCLYGDEVGTDTAQDDDISEGRHTSPLEEGG
jgi:hypothetical protein